MLKLQLYHGMYEESPPSLPELNEALRADGNAETYHLRGIANFQGFEFKDAERDFEHAVQMRPEWVEAVFHRGIVRVVRGNYDDAVSDFNRVIELAPDHAAAYYNRGRLRYWKGDPDGAIADFKEARRLDPLLGRELNLQYVIGKIERGPEEDSIVDQVQSILDRLRDL